jgi:hypothetical protein
MMTKMTSLINSELMLLGPAPDPVALLRRDRTFCYQNTYL